MEDEENEQPEEEITVQGRFGVDVKEFCKPKKFTTDEWVDIFIEYLEYMKTRVWNIKHPTAGKILNVPTSAPLSIRGFCVFAGIDMKTFYNYENLKGYEEYFPLSTRMRAVVESNQIEGAMVGAFNANIVARLTGLAEKKLIGGIKEMPIFPDLNKPDVSEDHSD